MTDERHGFFLKIADIGQDELVGDLGTVNKGIPAWLLTSEQVEAHVELVGLSVG